MPGVRDLLYRFRPAGAPGPPSAAAVPADRVADRVAELAPVFALLAETETRCAVLREEAARDAPERARPGPPDGPLAVAAAETARPATEPRRRPGPRPSAPGSPPPRSAARAEAARLLARAAARTPEWVARVAAEVGSYRCWRGGLEMSAGWVAAAVRARAMSRRRLGRVGARSSPRPPTSRRRWPGWSAPPTPARSGWGCGCPKPSGPSSPRPCGTSGSSRGGCHARGCRSCGCSSARSRRPTSSTTSTT